MAPPYPCAASQTPHFLQSSLPLPSLTSLSRLEQEMAPHPVPTTAPSSPSLPSTLMPRHLVEFQRAATCCEPPRSIPFPPQQASLHHNESQLDRTPGVATPRPAVYPAHRLSWLPRPRRTRSSGSVCPATSLPTPI